MTSHKHLLHNNDIEGETADICGFRRVSLRIINGSSRILKYGEAQWDKLLSRAFCLAQEGRTSVFCPILTLLQNATRSRNNPSGGVKKPSLFFLGNIS